jgi:short subunit dehydrogenase-like uncharacterized protein
MKSWLLYGAYGYTGTLIAKEAKDRGHDLVLAGRSGEKLIPMAEELDLNYVTFDLKNEDLIFNTIKDYDLIFNAAGPFKYTSSPIIKACLKSKSNYLDITGEIPVFEQNFKCDCRARENDIVIISGVGFDVVPTDCLAKYVSKKLQNPTSLEIGITSMSELSPGTLKTMLEYNNTNPLVRRNGELIPLEKRDIRNLQFSDQERPVGPATWGDLSTAYRTTGIPNITTYLSMPKMKVSPLRSTGVSFDEISSNEEAKNKVFDWIGSNVHGPDETKRQTNRCYIWASVHNDEARVEQTWLETMESYRFTAVAGVRCVEKVFDLHLKGALTPALAFGADFVLEIPETVRYDSLPK